MMTIPVVLLTLVFNYGGGEVKLTTKFDTIEQCETALLQFTASVGSEGIKVAKCEEKYEVVE